ncbi:respiratory chain complex I subunit 1 family protein [Lachnoclostridium phytofermentans]|uniref:Respiratory-chain NADH dehydrogenase subunit 1 n=1 Tax=Lachnoclostridium phytofermentans (strain ATCC 700394 / DSM 18823 / ISDg) TaxID=357809 RepID=A9KS71_LACP7|nr:complex I subunit 1 family protein [Lachnoclostridium phytofermentans]ABX42103.1 respiratory-chain NADH dehydrogenase subunit 1 [Lachnoclostridium phytofermentans ISDg]
MVILLGILFIILAPLVGGLLTGIDRVITARLQGRQGPPVLQPFYDVFKLIQKESIQVNSLHRFYVYLSLVFVVFTSGILLVGGDMLLAVFALTLGTVFFVLGGYSTRSPYSTIGAERELLQIMSYEPMVLLTCVSLYYVKGSFFVKNIIAKDVPAIIYLPGVFIGLIYIITIKLRKSPFDLSTSHHGHQEIVKGITTEYSGRDLAVIEITHWYEVIITLTLVFVFFATSSVLSRVLAVVACLVVYFLEIVIDNAFARYKWQQTLKYSWIVTGVLTTLNLIVLSFFH